VIEIDIEFVKAVAKEAGTKALGMLEGMHSELKADNSYVTNIDREIERFVRGRLAERYPDFAFLGEEFGRHGSESAPLWAVDPIDGTTNMVFGIPCWGVSIGLIEAGQAVAGALYLPCTDELFWGVRGEGAFCNGARLHARDREKLHAEDTLGFTSAAIKHLDVSALRGRLRCLGSIAADIAYTARGTLCSLIGWSEGAYDMAAALCIAREAGCVAAYLTGEPLELGVILRDGKTLAPFVIAPPKLAAYLQTHVRRRSQQGPEDI
jgi:myo-inositol-1(or 4)-monophosphatase